MKSDRRIVLLVTQPTIGGAALQVWQLATGLDRRAFDVRVISPADGWLRQRLLAAGVSHAVVPMAREIRPVSDLRSLIQLWSVIRRTGPHLVHCHSSKGGFLGRLACSRAAIPAVVYSPHGFPFEQVEGWRSLLYLTLEAAAARLTDRIICVSESERSVGIRRRLAPPDKFTVIRNGVAVPRSADQAKGYLRGILGVGPECQIIGMISRLRRPKLPEDLIRAAAILARREPGSPRRFVFIGAGVLQRRLVELARGLGVESQIVFLGHRDDVPNLMADIDVVVLSSSAEGMPYSILEAMASGKPAVGTRIRGLEDLIIDGQNGFGYPPREAGRLADVLQTLLRDEEQRRSLGAKGRLMVVEGFTSERMIREVEDLYRQLLGDSR